MLGPWAPACAGATFGGNLTAAHFALMKQRILIFDSGVGGLSVARAVVKRMPDAQVIYAADNAGFPYGDWGEDALNERICDVVGKLIDTSGADVAVIACNTASTIALERLRQKYGIPFVGTVPAIKPASETSETGIIGVLATPGTVERAYTRALVDTFASHREVILHGCKTLADMAERVLSGQTLEAGELEAEIAPVFQERDGGQRTDTVVLGCTHYPLIAREIAEAAPWPVKLIDPSDAVARQVEAISQGLRSASRPEQSTYGSYLTAPNPAYNAVLQREGFSSTGLLAA